MAKQAQKLLVDTDAANSLADATAVSLGECGRLASLPYMLRRSQAADAVWGFPIRHHDERCRKNAGRLSGEHSVVGAFDHCSLYRPRGSTTPSCDCRVWEDANYWRQESTSSGKGSARLCRSAERSSCGSRSNTCRALRATRRRPDAVADQRSDARRHRHKELLLRYEIFTSCRASIVFSRPCVSS